MARDGRALRRLPRQQPRLGPGLPAPPLPGARAARADLERGRLHRRHRRPAPRREMALAGCTGVFVGFESLDDPNLADARKKTPPAARLRAARRDPPRPRHPGERQLRPRLRPRRPRRLRPNRRVDRGEPARVRDVPHPDALPRHAALPEDGGRRAPPPPGLAPLRHRARRLPPGAHDPRAARRGLRLVLPAPLLGALDLAAEAARPDGRPRTSRCRSSTSARTPSGAS